MPTIIIYAVQSFERTKIGVEPGRIVACQSEDDALKTGKLLASTFAGAAATATTEQHGGSPLIQVIGRWGAVPDQYIAAHIRRPERGRR